MDGFHDDKYGVIVENAIRNHSAFRIDERLGRVYGLCFAIY